MPAVMQELDWKTSCGCAKSPAGAQLLPARRLARRLSRRSAVALHQRARARQHPEGRHLRVVPRMWGGVTTPNELRAIADVVDKFDIPTVKVTGGQRIDLLGRQEGGPARRLGRSQRGRHRLGPCLCQGPAHGEDLRRHRLVPLRHAGFDRPRHPLEKFLWGSWTPHKVKMAVSGCPRNCAEATCKDVGVICVDSGYEIHVGGAAGLDIKGTELLATVPTARGGASRSSSPSSSSTARARISRADLQMDRQGRARLGHRAGRRRPGRAARRSSSASISARRSPRSIPGPNGTAEAEREVFAPLADLRVPEAAE